MCIKFAVTCLCGCAVQQHFYRPGDHIGDIFCCWFSFAFSFRFRQYPFHSTESAMRRCFVLFCFFFSNVFAQSPNTRILGQGNLKTIAIISNEIKFCYGIRITFRFVDPFFFYFSSSSTVLFRFFCAVRQSWFSHIVKSYNNNNRTHV